MDTRQVLLTGGFVTALITAQVISSKLLALTLPVIGAVAIPGGTLAYAVTYLCTDALNELYGAQTAKQAVNAGFILTFLLLGLVSLTIHWPRAGGVPQETFAATLSPAYNIVAGSLVAYLISQHIDVHIFDRLRTETSGQYLWVRNIGSTTVSQFVDTVIFITVAFAVAPVVFGVGIALPLSVLISLIIGQYVAKLLIALIDTPLVYLITHRQHDTPGTYK